MAKKDKTINKNKGFFYDTKQIILPKYGKAFSVAMSMIFQIVFYSTIYFGVDYALSFGIKYLV